MWNTTKIWRLMWTEQYELLLRVPDLVKKLYEEPLNNNVQSSRTLIGMSACCSLDEPGKPSFVEHRSRLPPSQIALASSGRAPATWLTTRQAHQLGRTPRILPPRADPAPASACRCTAHPGGRRDAAMAARHTSLTREHARVVPGRGSQVSD